MNEISVIITCYNEENYIGQTIESVLNQKEYDAIKEIIVVNDGSNDKSEELIKKYANSNSKIKYIYQNNKGLSVARNTAIKCCSGNYIALLDGDDIWLNDKIKIQSEYSKKFPKIGLFYSDFYSFKDGFFNMKRIKCNHYNPHNPNIMKKFFIKGGPVIPSAVLINSLCFKEVGLFDPFLRRAEDTDMWLRILSKFDIFHIPEPLVCKRIRGDSLGANVVKKAEYLFYVTEKISRMFPELKKFKNRKLASIQGNLGFYQAFKENRVTGIKTLLGALKKYPFNKKNILKLLILLLPIKMQTLDKIRKKIKTSKF